MCFSSCLLKQNWHNVIPTTAFAFFHPGRKSPGISTHVSQFALSHAYLCKSTAVPLLKPAFKQIWEAYNLVDFMSFCKGWKCQWITCAPSLMAKFDILMCGKMSRPNEWRTTKRSIIERKFWGFRSDWGKLPWVMSIKFFPYEILELLLYISSLQRDLISPYCTRSLPEKPAWSMKIRFQPQYPYLSYLSVFLHCLQFNICAYLCNALMFFQPLLSKKCQHIINTPCGVRKMSSSVFKYFITWSKLSTIWGNKSLMLT